MTLSVKDIKPGMKLRVYYAARNRRNAGRWDNVTIIDRIPGTRRFKVWHEQAQFETEAEIRSIGPREFKHEIQARLRQEARDAEDARLWAEEEAAAKGGAS